MAIARYQYFAIDCPDAVALGKFYAALLDWNFDDSESGHWAEVTDPSDPSKVIAFQKIDGYNPPQWPGQIVPQQIHLDVLVDDLDEGEKAVLAIGATKHEHQPGKTFRVFLDPAGHPFCLCLAGAAGD